MNKVFELTNKYIVLATPLILFSLLSSIYIAISLHGTLINILIAIVLFALMTAAFVAGWFNMVKLAVLDTESENPNALIKNFVSGVGEYFLSSSGILFNVIFVSILFLIFAAILGVKFIGDPGVSPEALNTAIQTPEALKAFLVSLTPEQLIKINAWNLLLLGSMALTYFLEILYLPAVFFKNKNPFMAFFISLKDLFSRKFFQTLGIYLLIFVINFIISILAALFMGNVIMHFIITLINFYFVICVSVGVFYYYYNNFVKPQIGQNIDTRI